MPVQIPYWSEITFYSSEHAFSLFISFLILIIGGFFIVLVGLLLRKFFSRTYYDETLERFAQRGIAAFLWIILFIVIFANLGFDVTGFIAGLGVAGFIIGFATKDIFSNIAAGFLILITKPFKVGDDVEISGLRGVVKEINLSFCSMIGEKSVLIIMPNAKVWGNPIKNFSRLQRVRGEIKK